MAVVWSFPTRVVFGEGVATHVGREAVSLGAKRALLVSDAGVISAGLLERVVSALDEADIPHETTSEISSNPLEAEVLSAARAYEDTGADIVIGVGGGSVLDVAKAIRVASTHSPPLAQYDDAQNGHALIQGPLPPMIAIPTTAGTGSEVGRSSVVTMQATNRKVVIFSPLMMPNVALLDPRMTATMPPAITASTGMDALTHCVEAYCALGDHPMADAVALQGIGLCARSLRKAVTDGKDMDARGDMLKAAMMGAVAFQKGLGACHSLAHPLSAEFQMHHGLANALCLPAVLDFNRTEIPTRIAKVAELLGVRSDDEETLSFECAGAVRALRKKIGLAEGLEAAGIEEDQLERLAALAVEDSCHQLNPRPCTEEDMLTLYRASM